MFGMGTGGSLRLLSPEIGQCPSPSAAARSRARQSAVDHGLLTAFRLSAFAFASAAPGFRTLKTAQVGASLAPDHGAHFLLWHSSFSQISLWGHVLVLRSRFALAPLSQYLRSCFRLRFSCSLFPWPCSPLSPRSSPRPISIIKLHTLPHFHR